MKIKFECVHADTCLPDFWSGHHRPHVQIPVYPGMSLKDIKAALMSEVYQGAIAGSDDDTRLLTADWVPDRDVARAEALIKAVHAAINRIKPAKKGQRRFFQDVEIPDDDYCDSVYAFFVFMEI